MNDRQVTWGRGNILNEFGGPNAHGHQRKASLISPFKDIISIEVGDRSLCVKGERRRYDFPRPYLTRS